MNASDFNNITGGIQSLIAALAIVAGGTWALFKFVIYRERYPRVEFNLDLRVVGKIQGQIIGEFEMARKRRKHANKSALEDFADEVMSEHRDMKFLLNPKGKISMSDAISQLIEPFKDDVPDYNSFSNLVTFGCIAWNTSILPENQRNEALEKMIDVIPGKIEDRFEVLSLLGELMERKRRLFPDISRRIIEHKVTDRGNDFHIAIASTME